MPGSQSSGDPADHSGEPVSPIDIVQGKTSKAVGFARMEKTNDINDKATLQQPSIKSPRTARFAEATSVNSPTEPPTRSPFADPPATNGSDAAPKVSDVGFGYVADSEPSRHATFPNRPTALCLNPPGSPLKSALKSPGTAGRTLNPLSPTFREEQVLEHHEKSTEKENAKDLKVKTRVRLAKILLRGVNFGCSLIVLSLIATTFTIFNATKHLAPRGTFTPWAANTNPWPQILLLVIACVSLAFCIGVFYGYWRGGHRRAEKVAVYYTVFAVFFFIFSVVMWAVGAAILQNSKQTGNGKDLWGWSCKDNTRRQLFSDEVQYGLVCRMQDWTLVCAIIEIVVEIVTICIYIVVFYRFYSKRKLRKSMYLRDKARSDLYLAQLRTQSAPNTPGFPRTPGSPFGPGSPVRHGDPYSAAEKGECYPTQYASPKSSDASQSSEKAFQLHAAPVRASSTRGQEGTTPLSPTTAERVNAHMDAAPGEQTYGSVPIPSAYASPLGSPTFSPQSKGDEPVPGMALTTDRRVVSPNSS